jgi:hypothetical protein
MLFAAEHMLAVFQDYDDDPEVEGDEFQGVIGFLMDSSYPSESFAYDDRQRPTGRSSLLGSGKAG